MFGFISCDNDSKDSKDDTLYVKFINNSSSEYAITSIQIFNMGVAGTLDEPDGEFGDNILDNGITIAPGEYEFFYLEIPKSNYAYYRLGVDDGSGGEVLLHEQVDYTDTYEGTITHWGSDERTVSVTVKWYDSYDYIYVQSWSDFAGIE